MVCQFLNHFKLANTPTQYIRNASFFIEVSVVSFVLSRRDVVGWFSEFPTIALKAAHTKVFPLTTCDTDPLGKYWDALA